MKFVLFVEGYTEKKALANFFKRWLDPKLDKSVGIQVVRFEGWADLVKHSPGNASRTKRCNSCDCTFRPLRTHHLSRSHKNSH